MLKFTLGFLAGGTTVYKGLQWLLSPQAEELFRRHRSKRNN